MSFWSRIVNVFRSGKVDRDLDEELRTHIEEAIESGRDPEEARAAFGSMLRHREASRDLKLSVWLDSLRADASFARRQLAKRPKTSAAAILSLALGIGACTSAFRLVDALLFRAMPVAHADRLYGMVLRGTGPDGTFRDSDSNEYPQFLAMRKAVRQQAELIAVSGANRMDMTYGSDDELEKSYYQYVSGWMFQSFGLQPALGRLLTERDDDKPGAHPYAVLSYDYWTSRFGRDPKVVGRTFRYGNDIFQIIGVSPRGFTGTETGVFTDVFLPATMAPGYEHDDWSWIRTFVLMRPGGSTGQIADRLQAVWKATQSERAKGFKGWPPERLKRYLQQQVVLEPAAAGMSNLRKDYRVALGALAVIVGLVLLIACANVANLLTAQAKARSREMALRVSIGAGRGRLLQMMLVESGLLALSATCIGVAFAWWSAPFLVRRISTADTPARLALPMDWRVLAFCGAVALGVAILFGLMPALRASGVKPAEALRGAESPHSRQRMMLALIAAQVAFCFVVHFAAGAFVQTVRSLTNEQLGFSPDRVLTLSVVAKRPQRTELWYQAVEHLREVSGVENAALAGWPLLSGNGQNGFVSVNGGAPHPLLAYFLPVSPGWLATMKIPLLKGRDLRRSDVNPSVAVVNRAFANEYFPGQDPMGRFFDVGAGRFQVVGLVPDARYRNLREPITATGYLPMREQGVETMPDATFLVRTAASDPMAMVARLRQEIARTRPDFRVSDVRTQNEIDEAQTVRERLLAMLAVFFAGAALLLAGVGVYGVLDYSVLQRQREFGIRIAIGAPAEEVARRVAGGTALAMLLGSCIGAAAGLVLQPYIKTLLYGVEPFDWHMLVAPMVTIAVAFLMASVPAIARALRIDTAAMLRAD